MAKLESSNIMKTIGQDAINAAMNAVSDGIVEGIKQAESKEYTVQPNIKVDESQIKKEVAQQVKRAVSTVEPDEKIDLDVAKWFDIDISGLQTELLNKRKQLAKAIDEDNKAMAKQLSGDVFNMSRIAQLRGVKQVPAVLNPKKGKKSPAIPIAEYISEFIEDQEISAKQVEQLESIVIQHKKNMTDDMTATLKEAKDATKELEVLNDRVANSMKKNMSGNHIVKIMEDGREAIYDVNKDMDSLLAKFDELAKKMKTPVFHAGDLGKAALEEQNYRPADSLKFTVERKRFDSIGTGTYWASNYVDILGEATQNNKRFYADDLSRYSNLLVMQTEDELADYQDMLEKVSAMVMNTANQSETYQKLLGKTDSVDKIYSQYKDWFDRFHISMEQLQSFINEEVAYVKNFPDTKSMGKAKSIGTHLGQNLFKVSGIDVTKLDMSDSYGVGNIVYELDKQAPFAIDFGKNQEIAKVFGERVILPIMKRKAENLSAYIDDIAINYLPEDASQDMIDKYSGILEEHRQGVKSGKITPIGDNVGASIQAQAKALKDTAAQAEATGKAIEQSAEKATKATEKLVDAQDEVIEKQKEVAATSDNVAKSFATKNKTEAYNQLKSAYDEYQGYFGRFGAERDQDVSDISDAGREAGYAYVKAFEEAKNKGVADTRLDKLTVGSEELQRLDGMVMRFGTDAQNALDVVAERFDKLENKIMEANKALANSKGFEALRNYHKQFHPEDEDNGKNASRVLVAAERLQAVKDGLISAENVKVLTSNLKDASEKDVAYLNAIKEAALSLGLVMNNPKFHPTREYFASGSGQFNPNGSGFLDYSFTKKPLVKQEDVLLFSREQMLSQLKEENEYLRRTLNDPAENISWMVEDPFGGASKPIIDTTAVEVVDKLEVSQDSLQSELKQTADVGETAGESIAEGMREAREEAKKTVEALKDAGDDDKIIKRSLEIAEAELAAQDKLKEVVKETEQAKEASATKSRKRSIAPVKEETEAQEQLTEAVKQTEEVKEKATKSFKKRSIASIKEETQAQDELKEAVKETEEVKEKATKPFKKRSIASAKEETKAQGELKEAVKETEQVKEEAAKASDSSKAITEVKAEEQAHKDNAVAIKEEVQAKQESKVEDAKAPATDEKKAQLQAQLEILRQIRDEKKAAYEEEKAQLADLQARSDAYYKTSQDKVPYVKYQESFDNAKLSNFDQEKTKTGEFVPISHEQALYNNALAKARRYASSGNPAALGSAAGYYKQYVDALKDTEQEIQRVVVAGNDMSDMLLQNAEKLRGTKAVGVDNKEWNTINVQIGEVKKNIEELGRELKVAEDDYNHFEKAISKQSKAQGKKRVKRSLEPAPTPEITPSPADTGILDKLRQKVAEREQMKSNAPEIEEEAAAEEKLEGKIKDVTAAKKEEQAVSDNSEAVAEAEKEAQAHGEVTEKLERKIQAKKEDKAVSKGSKESDELRKEAENAGKVADAYEQKSKAQRQATAQAVAGEDFSQVLSQLARINDAIDRKNKGFYNEARIVKDATISEVADLKEVAEVVGSIAKNLGDMGKKKVGISFQGIDQLQQLIGKDLTGIVDALSQLANKELSIKVSAQGLQNLERLTALDVDNLETRITEAFMHIDDLAQGLKDIKIDDNSFLNSINRMLEDGQKLKDLASILKSTKKQIAEAGKQLNKGEATPREKPVPVDLTVWKQLLASEDEYYKIKAKGEQATADEKVRLDEIDGIWDSIKGNVNDVTAALKEQRKSTQVVEDVVNMFGKGFADYQLQAKRDQVAEITKQLKGSNPEVKIGGFEGKIQDYPDKYTDKLKAKVEELSKLIKEINSQKIEVVDDAQIQRAQELAGEIRQAFNSAEWKEANQTKVANLIDQISKYKNEFSGMSADFKARLDDLIARADKVGSAFDLQKVIQEFAELKVEIRDAGQETKSFWGKVGTQVEHLNAQFLGMYFSWMDVIRYIRQASEAVIELDSALTELRKVSDASTERLQVSFKQSAETAKELGSTIDAVINQTADWSRFIELDPLYGNV